MSTSTTTEPGTVLEYRLTAADRCDACGAQAYIAAEVNGSELLHTLEIFLHVRSRSEAARALYVHRNTLAQRLRRIEELTGLAASDSEEWFPLQLALEIHLLRHPRGPAR